MMYRLFFHQMFCFCLLLASNPALLSAQTYRTRTFSYDGDKRGSFKFSLGYYRGSDRSTIHDQQNGLIDMADNESGILRFAFYTADLEFQRNKHREDFILVVRPTCPGASTDELIPVSTDDLNVKYSRDPKSETLDFKVIKNGRGQLVINCDVVKDGETVLCDIPIPFNYNITGLTDPAVRLCERVISTFHADKFGAIDQLKLLKGKYPGAPCLGQVNSILDQHALWKLANDVSNSDCKKTKEYCAQYKNRYPGGYYATEIDKLSLCTVAEQTNIQPVKTKPKIEKNVGADEANAYKRIQPGDTSALKAFIVQWSAENPNSSYVKEAQKKLSELLPLQYEEKILPDGRRQYRLLNANRPRVKDMSLRSGLKLETDRLQSENIINVEPGTVGVYSILVKDAHGKEATINITNEFNANLSVLPGGDGWLLRIGGGKPPYQIYLTDADNPKTKLTWKGALNSDTTIITREALKKRGYNQTYMVVVKSSNRQTKPIDAGIVEGSGKEAGSELLEIIQFLLLLFIMTCAAYGVYLLFAQRRARARKATIYESIQ